MFYRKKSLLLFLLPGLAGVMLFYVAPFLNGLVYSFSDGRAKLNLIGLANYKAVWRNAMFQLGLKNSLILSFECAPVVWMLGFSLAALMTQLKGKSDMLLSSIFLPYVMPSSAVILIWLLLFDFAGPVNHILSALGIERVAFLSGRAMRVPVVLLFLWKNTGFAAIVFLSAMQAIPAAYYEYATLEGAGFVHQSLSITLPSIMPTCFLVIVLEWINAFRIFKEVYFIGGAYPDAEVYTLQNYMNNLYNKLNYPYVSAAAYSFAVILFAFFGLLFCLQRTSARTLEG